MDTIEADCQDYVQKYLQSSDLHEKQMILIEGIRTLDFLFSESIQLNIDPEYWQQLNDAFRYGYPSFLNCAYEDFSLMEDISLYISTEQSIVLSNRAIYACELTGLVSNFRELLELNVLKIKKNTSKYIHVGFKDKYPWVESIERDNLVKYSDLVQQYQKDKYKALVNKQKEIIEKMTPLVYLWKNNFIGYTTTSEIDDYFLDNAFFDAVEATEWNVFPDWCMFGGVPYSAYVNTVVYFMSLALKHLQYCHILMQKYPHLKIHDLLLTVNVQSETIDLIKSINNISSEGAKKIFDTLILDINNLSQHTCSRSASPPLIQLSKHQFIRSICGCLDRPFEFMIDALRYNYPKEWDSNTRSREDEFRKNLYDFFDDETNIKIDRGIVVNENGRIITDIDACIFDKITGDIAFIQLKWQDLVYSSNKILLSKKRNYEKKTNEWILSIKNWLKIVPERKLADYLGVREKVIDKNKIKIFVLGRFNGNFSGSGIPDNDVAWGQWYQVFLFMRQLEKKDQNVTTLFEYLKRNNPYNRPIITRPVIHKIGNHTIKFS